MEELDRLIRSNTLLEGAVRELAKQVERLTEEIGRMSVGGPPVEKAPIDVIGGTLGEILARAALNAGQKKFEQGRRKRGPTS